jgi:ribosomal protein L12E/L44/L45/RPP1/RPP2
MESKKTEGKIESKKNVLSLKKIKIDEKEEKRFFKKLTDVLMSFQLLPFFTAIEAKELGKINTKFYNSFVRYYERISDNLIKKYNVIMENDYDRNTLYEQKNDGGHFIKLNFSNLTHYLIFSYYGWAWKDDNRYWEKITPKNSILNKDIYKLKTVCYIDINAKMTHIYQGKYKLYLNHCVCDLDENKIKMIVSLDGIQLQEFIYPSKEQKDRCRGVHEEKKDDKKGEDKKEDNKKEDDKKEEEKKVHNGNQSNMMAIRPFGLRNRLFLGKRLIDKKEYNKDNSLFKEYIMDISVNFDENVDNGIGHEFSITFQHKEGSWKRNWLIDAVILEKISD